MVSAIKNGVLTLPAHDEHLEVRESVRKLLSRFPLSYWNDAESEGRFPDEFFHAFADAGWLGMTIDEEFGGFGAPLAVQAAVLEEVAAGGGALDACSAVHVPMLWLPVLSRFGTEEQKREYLPKVLSGELYVTFGVTEPDAGTDTLSTSTRAKRVDTGWEITGQKIWNSGALRGDKVLVLARTSPPDSSDHRSEGFSLFLVDLDAPGVRYSAIPKYTRNAVASCEVFFEQVHVDEDRLIGQLGQGFFHLLSSLIGERLLLSAEAVGIGRWAIESSVRYARDREIFGRAIGSNQGIQLPIADAYTRILGASELVATALSTYDRNEDASAAGALANAAKVLATEASFFACDRLMQTFGGYSFAREYGVGRHWAESRLQRIAPVSNELALAYIGERVLGMPRSY